MEPGNVALNFRDSRSSQASKSESADPDESGVLLWLFGVRWAGKVIFHLGGVAKGIGKETGKALLNSRTRGFAGVLKVDFVICGKKGLFGYSGSSSPSP